MLTTDDLLDLNGSNIAHIDNPLQLNANGRFHLKKWLYAALIKDFHFL